MVHFSADWADQCGQVTEVLKELLKLPEIESSNSKFGVCDAENLSEISLKYKVSYINSNNLIIFKYVCNKLTFLL